jgi:mono/diheme cytochrome c family protein
MTRARLAILIGIAVTMTAAACRPPEARESKDFERMRRQQRYDPYDRSSFFANGAVMQAPPAHTIARDGALDASGQPASPAFLTGRSTGAFVAQPPVAVDDSLLGAGAQQFAISCVPCHGTGGFGGGPIAPNLVEKRPPSLRSAPIAALPAGQLFAVITDGFGAMPPYGWQLPPAQRWAVVAYVRSLGSQPVTNDTRADSTTAAYLHLVDSLHAAHVLPGQIPPPPRGAR